MAYTSLNFMIFLTGIALLYYIVPKKMQWFVLLAASYSFYLFSGVEQVLFIVTTTVITYGSGLLMQRVRDRYKEEINQAGKSLDREKKREMKKAVNKKIRRIQTLTVLVCLLILAAVKYLNSFTGNINSLIQLFGYSFQMPLVNIIVPLGISFYTFQSIGYVIDVGRGKYEAERHFGIYALFVSFFPTIVQGPINRYDDLGTQFRQPHKFQYNNVTFGIQLMLWGFFKKLVIADRAAPLVSAVFSAEYLNYEGNFYFFGMLMYAAQIYCDFSGGIDIVRGAAQILDIHLPQNFERPYFSESVAEYWRRWHITLGAWMREYVFYPVMLSKPVSRLAKKFRGQGRQYLARMTPSVITPFVVFFLIGIWHGASWQYIAFGLYNATIVAGSVALEPVFNKVVAWIKVDTTQFGWKLFRIIRTFLITGVSKLLVIAPGFRVSLHMIKSIVTDRFNPDFWFLLDGQIYDLGISERSMTVLLIALLVLLIVSILQETGIRMRETIAKQNLVFRWCLYAGIIVVILVFGIYGPNYNAADFIYQAY